MPDGTPRPLNDSPIAARPDRRLRQDDAEFPSALLDLARPPLELHVRGEIPSPGRSIAIVGSRAASPYGTAQARRLAADLAVLGFAVVSGLARGIDAAAHRGALEAGGRTVAVLPGALDPVTPAHHAGLAREIAERGALVTEHGGGALLPGMFVERNRLIAALACATVVVEAAARSGALSTAAAARRIGRPVLAVPGDVDRDTARGCHALIRGGARLCEGAADVLAALAGEPPAPARGAAARGAAGERRSVGAPVPLIDAAAATPEQRLHAALSPVPAALEDLAARAGLSASDAVAALLRLEWAGVARPVAGQRWVRGGSGA